MATVQIPSSFFLKEVKQEYYDYKTRLCCEVLQNSLDAGATKIEFEFNQESMTFKDNGCGMTKERMVEAMLTMGGSVKENDSIGGFGKAKNLLLFSHKSFILHSLDTCAAGECLNYEFVSCEFFNGTKIKIVPTKDFNYDKVEMENKLKEFLEKCNLNCQIFINGQKFTNWKKLPFCRSLDWCDLLVGEKSKTAHYLDVYKNGLWMFNAYIQNLGKEVAIEVKGDSLDVFAQNRDGFKGKVRDKFATLISEITVDKHSFDRKEQRIFLIYGRERAWKALFNKLKKSISLTDDEFQVAFNLSSLEDLTTYVSNKAQNLSSSEIDAIIGRCQKNIPVDFVIDLADSDFKEIPKRFNVSTMLSKYKFLINLWKNCIEEIARNEKVNIEFSVGWIFGSKEAQFKREGNIDYFLINPSIDKFEQREDLELLVYEVMSVACHEFCHFQGYSYHDESFSCQLTSIIGRNFKPLVWRKMVQNSREDVVLTNINKT